jgi:hypothetical protein
MNPAISFPKLLFLITDAKLQDRCSVDWQGMFSPIVGVRQEWINAEANGRC